MSESTQSHAASVSYVKYEPCGHRAMTAIAPTPSCPYCGEGSPTTADSLRLVAVEHFDGDGRIVERVWQTFHWLTLPEGQETPDQIDTATLEPAVPECIYTTTGRALR